MKDNEEQPNFPEERFQRRRRYQKIKNKSADHRSIRDRTLEWKSITLQYSLGVCVVDSREIIVIVPSHTFSLLGEDSSLN